jgi:hypothetical protein
MAIVFGFEEVCKKWMKSSFFTHVVCAKRLEFFWKCFDTIWQHCSLSCSSSVVSRPKILQNNLKSDVEKNYLQRRKAVENLPEKNYC